MYALLSPSTPDNRSIFSRKDTVPRGLISLHPSLSLLESPHTYLSMCGRGGRLLCVERREQNRSHEKRRYKWYYQPEQLEPRCANKKERKKKKNVGHATHHRRRNQTRALLREVSENLWGSELNLGYYWVCKRNCLLEFSCAMRQRLLQQLHLPSQHQDLYGAGRRSHQHRQGRPIDLGRAIRGWIAWGVKGARVRSRQTNNQKLIPKNGINTTCN